MQYYGALKSLCNALLLLSRDWRSNVIGRSVCLSVSVDCLSVCQSVSRITHKCGNGRRPNMPVLGKCDPLEVINFRW